MGQEASGAPDGVHFAPLLNLSGLAAEGGDDLLPKPPKRMKKIKFLSDVREGERSGE
jgi:hypothetical protein